MTIICHCRNLTDENLQKAFEEARDANGGDDIRLADTLDTLGKFDCGSCAQIFHKAVQDFNETGEVNVLGRDNGLCSKASQHKYPVGGVPNLRGDPTDGIPNLAAE